MLRAVRILCLLALIPYSAALAQTPASWTQPLKPFQIADNLYYVGGTDLAAFLVTTPAGNILINANYAAEPTLIRNSVEQLGFRWKNTKILLDGQAHADHMGGAVGIIRETGAQDIVMDGDDDVVRSGGVTDFAFGPKKQFAPAKVDRVLHDGDKVTLGGVTLIAHKTAGHTRGCTTWTLRVHLPGEPPNQLRDVVIVGGYDPLSNYKLLPNAKGKGAYPGIGDDFRHTYATLRDLPCDIFLGAHAAYFNMDAKLARMPQQGPTVWLDSDGYKAAIAAHEKSFEETLARQQAASRTKS